MITSCKIPASQVKYPSTDDLIAGSSMNNTSVFSGPDSFHTTLNALSWLKVITAIFNIY